MLKIVYHEDYLTNYYTSAAESPVRISAIYNKLSPCWETVAPVPAPREDILRVHTMEHIRKVQEQGSDTYATALLAAGGALCAIRLATEGEPAFACIRPPGHHAGRSRFGGFCFFNNMAVAVMWALESGRAGSAVIVDTDMHWGDGTQDIFKGRKEVSIIDIRARDREAYLHLLLESLESIPPVDILAVSAGFDHYVRDWGGLLETSDFNHIGDAIRRAARDKAGGRVFAVLEGGYYLNHLGRNVLAFCRGLDGECV